MSIVGILVTLAVIWLVLSLLTVTLISLFVRFEPRDFVEHRRGDRVELPEVDIEEFQVYAGIVVVGTYLAAVNILF